MRSDDRGRVPFALVGVLLLVSSAALASTTAPREPPGEPAVGTEMDRAAAETQTAVRDGALAASRQAASEPVVERANTTAGRALNESVPFVDALRVRIYVAVRERLEAIDRRRDDVRVTASLPPLENVSDLEAAKRRVDVERADENGTAMTVRVTNVTLTASRDGRVVNERDVSPRVTVATPVLAMHERVTAYQRHLDAGVTEPGLDRRLTARLYAIAWARGYAQYGGAPIDNVVANRHVSVATNAGLLDVQRAAIGHSDPAGRRTLARATAKTAAEDLVSASGVSTPPGTDPFSSPTRPPPNDVSGLEPPAGPRHGDERVVGVNGSADDALLDLVEQGTRNESIDGVYGADVRLQSRVDRVDGGTPGVPPRPAGNWTLEDERTSVEATTGSGSVAAPAAPAGWHRLDSFGAGVVVDRTRTRHWRNGNETRTTSTSASERVRVGVAVVGRHHTSERAPRRGIDGAHERGRGPLDGPNLADVEAAAEDELVESRGGRGAVVRRAATGSLDERPVTVEADRPDGIADWVYRDLMALRERVRAIQVEVERGEVGSYGANPPSMLADRVRDRRADLVDAPATYDSAASKARIAAREAYVDRVLSNLRFRAYVRNQRMERIDGELRDQDAGSLADARHGMDAVSRPPREGSKLAGVGDPVRLRVDSAPSYLTRGEVTSDRVPAMDGPGHPLVARNVNVFTVPYDDATDVVLDRAFDGSERGVRLDTAGRTLRAANETLDHRDDPTVRDRRDELQSEVADANAAVRRDLHETLADEGVGDSWSERHVAVRDALAPWNTTATRAVALANGSASDRVAAVATDRADLTVAEADELRLRLGDANREALGEPEAMPAVEPVGASRTATREVAGDLAEALAENATERAYGRATNETFDEMPAGLPVSPVPGHWYATTNVWHVTVRGEYARFGVRADRGRPTTPGGEVTYVRRGQTATLDVDGDGEAERLGRAPRVDFDVSTTVVVVVPAGGTGVGDTDGNADERSPGWPDPGPE